jgi:hypothetical protein
MSTTITIAIKFLIVAGFHGCCRAHLMHESKFLRSEMGVVPVSKRDTNSSSMEHSDANGAAPDAHEAPVSGKAAIEDVTMCTLVDPRQAGRVPMELVVKHLLDTSHVSQAVVLVDCSSPHSAHTLKRVAALQSKVSTPFSYECVNDTKEAHAEFARVWTAEPEFIVENWPGSYKGTIRAATHQCLWHKCKTKYCAWADSDLLMLPMNGNGWVEGMRDCLRHADDKFPVFAPMRWVPPEESLNISKNQSRHLVDISGSDRAIESVDNTHEFSGQVYAVDRQRLFNSWLPFHKPEMTTWRRSFNGRPLMPALYTSIEAFIVGKADFDCPGATDDDMDKRCWSVVNCEPASAYHLHMGETNRSKYTKTLTELALRLSRFDNETYHTTARNHKMLKEMNMLHAASVILEARLNG